VRESGANPVFVTDVTVYQIDDASKGTSGQKVTITESMDGNTIKIESVKVAD
jgi:hypothetical protein